MRNDRREMRRLGVDEHNYEEFKLWYSDKYNRKIHDSLEEFLQFIKGSETEIESFLQINNVLKEWRDYDSKVIEDVATVEDYLLEELNNYFQNLNEFGYIYETRNLSIGDSSTFHDIEDEPYSIQINSYAVDIGHCLNDESFVDVKKRSAYNKTKKALVELIDKEVRNSSVSGKLSLFEKSVKLVFEDLIIRKASDDAGGNQVCIRLGIKVL